MTKPVNLNDKMEALKAIELCKRVYKDFDTSVCLENNMPKYTADEIIKLAEVDKEVSKTLLAVCNTMFDILANSESGELNIATPAIPQAEFERVLGHALVSKQRQFKQQPICGFSLDENATTSGFIIKLITTTTNLCDLNENPSLRTDSSKQNLNS